MKKNIRNATILFTIFILWTAVVCLFDVQKIGPDCSAVGLATLNSYFHNLTGVHMTLYTLTDWLGLIPFGVMISFSIIGLFQWFRRKSILKVDRSILTLGGFYLAVLSVYVFFECYIINYRPVLIDDVLEASYPSSTTMLVLCVMPTANMQLKVRIKNLKLQRICAFFISAFTVFMVLGRLISGVHWLSDIIGGCLISAALIFLYSSIS